MICRICDTPECEAADHAPVTPSGMPDRGTVMDAITFLVAVGLICFVYPFVVVIEAVMRLWAWLRQ